MSRIDKHDWLVTGDYHVRLDLYCFGSDNPYDHVMLIKLARLAWLVFPHVNTTWLLFACYGQLQFGDLLMGRLLGHRGEQSALDVVHGVE